MTEAEAMARALELAWRGWGRVHPNPMVGAVLLRGGAAVAEGWHAEYGGAHAEAAALAAAGERARGATLAVTLEPCSHHGKQPPCTEAVLRAGVRRVVVAIADPNPAAAGGAALLRSAGLEVEIGLGAGAAAAQNAVFLHGLRDPARPFVALKLATSLDGRIADRAGSSKWISGAEAREYVHWLRAGFDAVAVGGRTARHDDPSLTVRGPVVPRVPPRRVVLTAGADLPASHSLVRTAREVPTVIVAGRDAPRARVAELERAGITVLCAADPAAGLQGLRSLGITSMLVEGGGRLAGALLAAGVVDRYYWIQSPLWLGSEAVPAVAGLPGGPLGTAERWRVVERRALGSDTLLVADRAACSLAS